MSAAVTYDLGDFQAAKVEIALRGRQEHLTPEQETRLPKFREEWLRWGLCTDRADRPKAEAAILAMRAEIGNTTKPKFLWVESPAAALVGIALLKQKRSWASLGDSLGASLRASLWDSLGDSLGDSLWDSLRDSLGDSLRDSLGDSLWASLGDSLGDSLRASLRDSLGDSLRASLRDSLGECFYGQIDAYWISLYLFCRDELGVAFVPERARQLDLWRDLAQSCGWWWCYENIVVISERPTVATLDVKGVIHGKPAVAFADGFEIDAKHGKVTATRLGKNAG